MIYIQSYSSPIGPYTITADGENLTGIWRDRQKYYGKGVLLSEAVRKKLLVFDQARDWLDRYFAGREPDILELPLAPMGSKFCQSVWRELCKIPYGKTTTYGAIAKKIGCKSARAVGQAVGHNPISIIIPCHRVVGTNGSLTGYAGGLSIKIKLLELEGVTLTLP